MLQIPHLQKQQKVGLRRLGLELPILAFCVSRKLRMHIGPMQARKYEQQ